MAVRLGIAFCTERITAEAHGFTVVSAVRYAPSPEFAELADPAREPAWQDIQWYGEAGDVVLVGRSPEQAVVEIEGE